MTSDEAERTVRAYNPWPGAFVTYGDQRLAVWAAHSTPMPTGADVGSLIVIEGQPAITFTQGLLFLDAVQRLIDLRDELALAIPGAQLERAFRLGRGPVRQVRLLGAAAILQVV